MNKFKSILIVLTLAMYSCIKENYDSCPDYGKYKVIFIDYNQAKVTANYNVIITDNKSIQTINRIENKYIRLADTSLLKSENTLRLLPGIYNFKALLSSNQMICLNKKIQLKNNSPYLYADTSKTIIKKSYNSVYLKFSLANSLIQSKCILDREYTEKYKISKVLLSCPDDSDIHIDLVSGICNYSQSITDFFEEAIYDSILDIYNNYCVPIIKYNYLNFRVLIEDIEQKTENSLFCRIFLNTDISQGKVYQFHFNVTPFEIQYMNVSISDWDERMYNTIIPFI